jgi:hypothetical protein
LKQLLGTTSSKYNLTDSMSLDPVFRQNGHTSRGVGVICAITIFGFVFQSYKSREHGFILVLGFNSRSENVNQISPQNLTK